jgi:RNA recognition motif-containing protein
MKEQFNQIIKSENLKDITIDLVEKVLDDNIGNDIIKEIPILKSLVTVRNIYNSYTDRIFIKKAMNVLLELGDTNWKERIELTSDLDDKYSNGSEKILMAIDNLQTIEKCKIFGRLCKLKALGEIDLF